MRGRGQNTWCNAEFSEKCPFSHNNNSALIKHISLFETVYVMTNTKSFNSKCKKILLTNEDVKTDIWHISPHPSPNTIKEYFTLIRLGLILHECNVKLENLHVMFKSNSIVLKNFFFLNLASIRAPPFMSNQHFRRTFFCVWLACLFHFVVPCSTPIL